MTYIGSAALQAAIITTLRGNATVLQLLGGAYVFDEVPATQGFPYVAFDTPMETPDRSFGLNGHSLTCTLIVYTQDGSATKAGVGSAGYKQGFAIAEAILAALINDAAPYIAVAGHDVTDIDVESVIGSRLADGITRVIEITLTALLEDNGT